VHPSRAQTRGMIRIDPARPPVWRSATCLQFGVDPVVLLDDPAPWQERLVRDLERGIPDPGYRGLAAVYGATSTEAERFLRLLAPALTVTGRRPPRATVQIEAGFSAATAQRVTAALAGSGIDVTVDDAPVPAVPGGDAVVLLAQHVVEPRRAAALMAADRAHLPVVFTADRVEVGPLVTPGLTACLWCVESARRDADPAWPWILAQLIGRPAVDAPPALALEAGVLAARLLSDDPDRAGWSAVVTADSLRRRWHAHRPREDCGCRSPGGTATASAHDDRWSAPTTR
jgi:hypothetical protein